MGEGTVDLARLAAGYDHRIEAAAVTHATMAADVAGLGPGNLAVDVGGGRGAHARVFADRGSRALVVDRSVDMVRAARDAGVLAAVGDGARLPLAEDCARLVYFHLSIHHGDAATWLAEAGRVVAADGTIWVWTLAREHHQASLLAQWFPSVGRIDTARFPDPAALAATLKRQGMSGVGVTDRIETVHRTVGSWTSAVRAGFVSTLHLIDPGEIEAGLAVFERSHPDPDEVLEYTLHYAAVTGTRAG